ncbi:MAG: hypothetical protein JWO30_4878 [Fibrobacteres bacterium]|nr:hypothetical protein [Fibrobacterota bacterium]
MRIRMEWKSDFALAGALALLAVAPSAAQHKLDLQQALPLDGPVLVQPSGLAWDGKNLLMVSSFHDDEIFKIELQADKAVFKEQVKIHRGKETAGLKMSWRGLASDGNGNLYLASDGNCRIMKVESDGDAEWEGPGMLETGAEKGLFSGENAGIEGIAFAGKRKFVVAASREPRGLLQADLTGAKPVVTALIMDKSKVPLPAGRRKPDFSDLAEDKGQLWALSANADALCQLKWNGKEYAEGEYWTFGHVSNDPKYRYAGLKMGLARGLAMDGQAIYVVLDNKGVGRQGDLADKRPLLLVFKRPRGV